MIRRKFLSMLGLAPAAAIVPAAVAIEPDGGTVYSPPRLSKTFYRFAPDGTKVYSVEKPSHAKPWESKP